MRTETDIDETDQLTDSESLESSNGIRIGQDLVRATASFAEEDVTRSWWHAGLTFILIITALTGTAMVPWWPVGTILSVLGAPLMVRAFITYHDYMHGAILHGSRVTRVFFRMYAALALTPPHSWRKSHNYHHSHVGQISAANAGSFPMITTKRWRASTPAQRASYRNQRHPLVVQSGYLTIFACNICISPLLHVPLRHWDSALALRG